MKTNLEAILVVIYNHRYVENIDLIEAIYKYKFSLILHLMPFYQGNRKNVISVYEKSIFFQNYVAQAWKVLRLIDCSHFIFIADDLLLNPSINKKNYYDVFSVDDITSFLGYFDALHNCKGFWLRCKEAIEYNPNRYGVEVINILPSIQEALDHYKRHGLEIKPLPEYLVNPNKTIEDQYTNQKKFPLPYPLIGGYSDIFVVPKSVMEQFVLYCGIFAATDLFVELAIPSALAMASPKLVSTKQTKLKDGALWTSEQKKILDPYKNSLSCILSNFPKEYMYLHPIKLSIWR